MRPGTDEGREATPRRRRVAYLVALVLLAGALSWGRSRDAPKVESPIRQIFPQAEIIKIREDIHAVYDEEGGLLGWAGTGRGRGYGGPLTLLVGIDTLGKVAGVEVLENRETPIFWRMVRAPEYFRAIRGESFDSLSWEYADVVGVTGATLSAQAIVQGVQTSVVKVAATAFDTRIPVPPRPFEFGLLEIIVLVLFAMGILGIRLRGPLRRRARWASQIGGLVMLGFWKDSPVTLAKISGFLSGYLPDPRVQMAMYLLVAGFVLTSLLYGRNLYCLYACPFGAAQRVVGVIGGSGLKVSPRWARLLEKVRDVVVFAALFIAFLTARPVLASYEPFAALFSLRGTTLQWLLLFVVLVASLAVRTPWCSFFCPMRSVEVALRDLRNWMKGRGSGGPPGKLVAGTRPSAVEVVAAVSALVVMGLIVGILAQGALYAP